MQPNLADLCQDLPIERFEAGDILIAEGHTSGRLLVLVEGEVEILKEDFQVNTVGERGAILGDMSVLLRIPHTATVRAMTPCAVHVSEGGDGFLRSNQEIAYQLAQTLAKRLHSVTTYLVDLKHQYEGETGTLGVVDEVLEALLHQQPAPFTAGSDRDPGY